MLPLKIFSHKLEVIPLLHKCNFLKITPLVYRDLHRGICRSIRHSHPNLFKNRTIPNFSLLLTHLLLSLKLESLAKKIKIFEHRKSLDSSLSLIDFLLTFFAQPETGASSRSLSLNLPPITSLRRQLFFRKVSDISSETFSLPYLTLSANLL